MAGLEAAGDPDGGRGCPSPATELSPCRAVPTPPVVGGGGGGP